MVQTPPCVYLVVEHRVRASAAFPGQDDTDRIIRSIRADLDAALMDSDEISGAVDGKALTARGVIDTRNEITFRHGPQRRLWVIEGAGDLPMSTVEEYELT